MELPELDDHLFEMRRSILDRLATLEAELDMIRGRYNMPEDIEDGGRSDSFQSDSERSVLASLTGYPEAVRRQVDQMIDRTTRSKIVERNLRGISQQIITATKLIERWFAGPASSEVPAVLKLAVERTMVELRLKHDRAIVTTGPADRLETYVPDAYAAVFKDVLSGPGPDDSGRHAVVHVPSNESDSPRWWPIVLGHELSHQYIADRLENKRNILQELGLLDVFPRDEMAAALEADRRGAFDGAPVRTTNESDDPQRAARDDSPSLAPDVAERVKVAGAWVEECICDLAMVRRFGSAGLAALANYLVSVGDWYRLSASHPTARFRVALMVDQIGESSHADMNRVVDIWRGAASMTGADPEWAKVLEKFIADNLSVLERFVDDWPGKPFDTNSAETIAAVELARRQLELGLPPHSGRLEAFPSPDREAPDYDGTVTLTPEAILNAAWQVITERDYLRDLPVDRLVQKSLETLEQLESRNIVEIAPEDGVPDGPVGSGGGSVLGPDAIRLRLSDATPIEHRLIMTPRPEHRVRTGSIDLRLGNKFIVFQRTATSSFNASKRSNPRAVQRMVERAFYDQFVLHPGEVVLASALEYVALPVDVGAQVITRSSYGRLGLITATAVQVHPLYRGCLTLELVNLGTVPLELSPGEPVAQLVFFNVETSQAETDSWRDRVFAGTYRCPTGPQFPEIKTGSWASPPRD